MTDERLRQIEDMLVDDGTFESGHPKWRAGIIELFEHVKELRKEHEFRGRVIDRIRWIVNE